MVTMDSDSASQDSDEGRRFRFEATRKDSSNIRLDARRARASSPIRQSSSSRRRSRSRSRSQHQQQQQHRSDDRHRDSREDASRSRLEHRKRRGSRERSNGPRENSKYSRTHSDRVATTYRDVSPKCERRDSRSRDNKRHHERSSQDKKETSDRREKFRETVTRSWRDTNAQNRTRVVHAQSNSRRKMTRNDDAEVTNMEKRDGWDDKKDSRVARDCENLNLSDFDVVSDTEEHSSDASSTRRPRRLEERTFRDNDDSMKKRVSRQHYERLVKRQETLKRRRSREDVSNSPKTRNGGDGDGSGSVEPPTSGTTGTPTSRKSPDTSLIPVKSNVSHDKAENFVKKDSYWGPALPPKSHDKMAARGLDKMAPQSRDLASTLESSLTDRASCKSIEEKSDTLRVVGPTLPENFRLLDPDDEDDDAFGPALPPHLSASDNSNKSKQDDTNPFVDEERFDVDEHVDEKASTFGSDEDDLVGPLPIDHPDMENDAVQQRLEMRARRLKAELAACDKEDEKKREEWMMELPPVKGANLGLGPRKFRTRAAPDMSDRSSWTDTPADRARKRMEKLENKNVCEPAMRNEAGARGTSVEVEKSRKREKSLLEIHQKRLHKKKKKEEKEAKRNGKKPERRPFDRDIDLQANRFDEARKKSMFLKTATRLDDRFSRGNI